MSEKGNGDRRQTERKKVPVNIQAEVGIKPITEEAQKATRRFERKLPPDNAKVKVYSQYESPCQLVDVSVEGLRIASIHSFQEKQKIGVFFVLPGADEEGISCICEVVWHKKHVLDYGMSHLTGLRILDLTNKEGFMAFVDKLPAKPREKARN